MHDYMICIDENGSPYLAHALFGNKKGSQKKDHKYVDRIMDKAGKWRYFYTQEEAKAYANKGKKAVKGIAKTVEKIAKNPIKTGSVIEKAINKNDIKYRFGLGTFGEVDRAVTSAKSAAKATGRVVSELAKEAVKPLDRKKKSVLNNIHEKFKDVTLDTIGSVIDKDGAKARKNLKYFDNDMSGFTKAVYGLFGARAVNELAYNSSKLKKIENFLDSPIAALHDAKYQQYAWKAGTTGFDKPKEIMSNAKKAWDERVKRDNARAKSMKRRGVSPQTLLR